MKIIFEYPTDEIIKKFGIVPAVYERLILITINKLNKQLKNRKNGKKIEGY